MLPQFLSKENDFLSKKEYGDKINYMSIIEEVALRSAFSVGKTNKIINFYNDFLLKYINQGYIIEYPNLFYFGYSLKSNKNNDLINISDFIDVTKFNRKDIPVNLIHNVNLSPESIIKIIDNYNNLFKQLLLYGKCEFSFLQLFYLKINRKTSSMYGLRSLEVFNTKPNNLIFLVTNGKNQWLQEFNKKEYQADLLFKKYKGEF